MYIIRSKRICVTNITEKYCGYVYLDLQIDID